MGYRDVPPVWRADGEDVQNVRRHLAAGGVIRVALVDAPQGWVAHFCSDPPAGMADILRNVAGRFSLELASCDLKEVVGAGTRSSVGCGRAWMRTTSACGCSP